MLINMKTLCEFGKYIEIQRIQNQCHIWSINADTLEAANEKLLIHRQLGQSSNSCSLKMSLKEMEKIMEPAIIRLSKIITSQENLHKFISSLNNKVKLTPAESILVAYIEMKMDWEETSQYNLDDDYGSGGYIDEGCKCSKQNQKQREQYQTTDENEEQKKCEGSVRKVKYAKRLEKSIETKKVNQLQNKEFISYEPSGDTLLSAKNKIDQIAAQENDNEEKSFKVYKKGKTSKQIYNNLKNIPDQASECIHSNQSTFSKTEKLFQYNPSELEKSQNQYYCKCNSKIIDNPLRIDWQSLHCFQIEELNCKFILRPVEAIDLGVVLQGDDKLVKLQKEADILNSGTTITIRQLNIEFLVPNNRDQDDLFEIPERVSSCQKIMFPAISPLVVSFDLRKINGQIIDFLKLYIRLGFPQRRPYLRCLFHGEVEGFIQKTIFLYPSNKKGRLLVSFVPALLSPPGTSLAVVASQQIQEAAIDHTNLENEMIFKLILFHRIGFQFRILNSLSLVLFDLLVDEQ